MAISTVSRLEMAIASTGVWAMDVMGSDCILCMF